MNRVLVARNVAVGVAAAGGGRGGPGARCSPTCPRRCSSWIWSAPDRLPPRLAQDLDHFRWDSSTVKVDWALSAPVPWANPAVAGAGTVHLGGDLDGLSRYATALACGEVPEHPFL